MNKYSYPDINFIEYADHFVSIRNKFINENRKYISNANNYNFAEFINNHNKSNRIKSKLEEKLEKIILTKSHLIPSHDISVSELNLIIKIRKYFEINNILYTEYDFSQMKFIKDSEINYIFCLSLLSFILMDLFIDSRDFNYLNTAFKINDLLQNINPIDNYIKMSYILLIMNKEKLILDQLLIK